MYITAIPLSLIDRDEYLSKYMITFVSYVLICNVKVLFVVLMFYLIVFITFA